MSRINPVDRETSNDRLRKTFDAIQKQLGVVPNMLLVSLRPRGWRPDHPVCLQRRTAAPFDLLAPFIIRDSASTSAACCSSYRRRWALGLQR